MDVTRISISGKRRGVFSGFDDGRVPERAFLALKAAKFSVELKLGKEKAELVDRVTAHFERRQDAPGREDFLQEACHIILES